MAYRLLMIIVVAVLCVLASSSQIIDPFRFDGGSGTTTFTDSFEAWGYTGVTSSEVDRLEYFEYTGNL